VRRAAVRTLLLVMRKMRRLQHREDDWLMFIHCADVYSYGVVVASIACETCRCTDAASSDEEDAETAAQRR